VSERLQVYNAVELEQICIHIFRWANGTVLRCAHRSKFTDALRIMANCRLSFEIVLESLLDERPIVENVNKVLGLGLGTGRVWRMVTLFFASA